MSTVMDNMHKHVMGFGEWLRKERKARRMKQAAIADIVGRDQGTISRWENGGRVEREEVEAIGKALGDVAGALAAFNDRGELLPRFGTEQDASPYLYALSNVQNASAGLTRLPDSAAPGEDIRPGGPVKAIRIVGSCMEPLLRDGDIALVLPAESVRDGDAVLALVDGGITTCKRARISDAESWLETESGERIEEPRFLIVGVVAHKITRV